MADGDRAARCHLHREDVPTVCVDTDHLAGSLVGAWLGDVTLAIRAAAEGEEPAVGRPVDVVNLVLPVENLEHFLAELRVIGVDVDRHDGQLVVARAPRDVFSVRTESRAAAVDAEIDDLAAVGLNQQVGVAMPHSGVHGGDDPLAVGRVADVVEVVQRLGVDVLASLAAR